MAQTLPPQLETEPPIAEAPAPRTFTSAPWRRDVALPSLPESHRSIPISHGASWLRKMLAFAGPGYLVAVGYMDPGNWATDIAGGSKFGYSLLFVIMASNLMAVLLQSLSLKLGVATERDLAQLCNEAYGRWVRFGLWVG